jgi:hypothetical protein
MRSTSTFRLVFGVVADGQLVYVRVWACRILSRTARNAGHAVPHRLMTKAFTALTVLKLRDDGKLQLDAPAENYVPELKNWKYPTTDAPRIRARDLLNHTTGLVTDDPWGDRQTPLPEHDFTQLLRNGASFNNAPGLKMEYSNPLRRTGSHHHQRLRPAVCRHHRRHPDAAAGRHRLASGRCRARTPRQGYQWADNAWTQVPTMAHGASVRWAACKPARSITQNGWATSVGLAGARRCGRRPGQARHRARAGASAQTSRHTHAPRAHRYGKLPPGGQLAWA